METALREYLDSKFQTIEDKIDVIDGYHDVPSANSEDNVVIRDVVGNKLDLVTVPYVNGDNSIAAFTDSTSSSRTVNLKFYGHVYGTSLT